MSYDVGIKDNSLKSWKHSVLFGGTGNIKECYKIMCGGPGSSRVYKTKYKTFEDALEKLKTLEEPYGICKEYSAFITRKNHFFTEGLGWYTGLVVNGDAPTVYKN